MPLFDYEDEIVQFPTPKRKKRRFFWWILLLIIAGIVGFAALQGASIE